MSSLFGLAVALSAAGVCVCGCVLPPSFLGWWPIWGISLTYADTVCLPPPSPSITPTHISSPPVFSSLTPAVQGDGMYFGTLVHNEIRYRPETQTGNLDSDLHCESIQSIPPHTHTNTHPCPPTFSATKPTPQRCWAGSVDRQSSCYTWGWDLMPILWSTLTRHPLIPRVSLCVCVCVLFLFTLGSLINPLL